MQTLELFLVLIIAVLVSSLIDRRTPHIAAPLVQIAVGLVLALALPISPVIEADTELFMLVFIAPLLFYESRELDKEALWKDKGTVLVLAIGLVLVMMVLVGLLVHFLLPEIPLALCFALGAALGPTDAAAVAALSHSTKFPKRIESVLGAEAIFNDATGVVAFEFALAAAVSGAFEPPAAVASFLIEFVGGLALGTLMGAAGNWLTTVVHGRGERSANFHVLFEIALPFLAFLAGQGLGVSGVLAAVGAGLVFDLRGNGPGADVSRTKVISNGIWKVAAFALNGIVFVLLGLQLPGGFDAIVSSDLDTASGFATVLLVLLLVIAFRFCWCNAMVRLGKRPWGDDGQELAPLATSALLTFGGAKGAITMAAILTMPAAMAGRNALVFVASSIIIATLLLANFAMPRFLPKPADGVEADDDEARLGVLRQVMVELPKRAGGYPAAAMGKVLGEYRDRIVNAAGISVVDEQSRQLRIQAIGFERERLAMLRETGGADALALSRMEDHLDQKEHFYAGKSDMRVRLRLAWKRFAASTLSWLEILTLSLGFERTANDDEVRSYSQVRNECEAYAIEHLKVLSSEQPEIAERISSLIADYTYDMQSTFDYTPQVEDVAHASREAGKLRLEALALEDELIDEAEADGRINPETAGEMRRATAMIRFDAQEMI